MSSSTTLKGLELIDCARANAKQGPEVAAQLCGYGTDIDTFQKALQDACHDIGVEISELSDLLKPAAKLRQREGIDFAPDTNSSL